MVSAGPLIRHPLHATQVATALQAPQPSTLPQQLSVPQAAGDPKCFACFMLLQLQPQHLLLSRLVHHRRQVLYVLAGQLPRLWALTPSACCLTLLRTTQLLPPR